MASGDEPQTIGIEPARPSASDLAGLTNDSAAGPAALGVGVEPGRGLGQVRLVDLHQAERTGGEQHRHGQRPEAGPGRGAPGHRDERRPGPLGHRLQLESGAPTATSRAPRRCGGLGGAQRLRAATGRGHRDHHVGGADPAGHAGAAVPDDRHRAARPGDRGQHVAGTRRRCRCRRRPPPAAGPRRRARARFASAASAADSRGPGRRPTRWPAACRPGRARPDRLRVVEQRLVGVTVAADPGRAVHRDDRLAPRGRAARLVEQQHRDVVADLEDPAALGAGQRLRLGVVGRAGRGACPGRRGSPATAGPGPRHGSFHECGVTGGGADRRRRSYRRTRASTSSRSAPSARGWAPRR